MSAARIDSLVWVAIYLGLILLGLGLALKGIGEAGFGWTVAGFGIASVATGILLIWLRSRMKAEEEASS